MQQSLAQTASAKGFSHNQVIDNRDGRAVGDVREDEQVEKTSDHIIDLRHPSPVTRVAPQRIPHGLLAVGSTRHELCEQRLDFEEIVGTYMPDPHRELLQRVRVPEVNFFSESYCFPFTAVGILFSAIVFSHLGRCARIRGGVVAVAQPG